MIRPSRSLLSNALQIRVRRYSRPSHPLGPYGPPLSPLGPHLPPPDDLVAGGPLAPPNRREFPICLNILENGNILGTRNVDSTLARRLNDQKSLIEQFEHVKKGLICRGMLSPYKKSDLESRFINDAFCKIHHKDKLQHLTAVDLMTNLVTLPTDFWRHCLDFLMREGVVIYEEWDCEPTVCIRFVMCDQGAGFMSTEGVHYLRGESDGSCQEDRKKGIKTGNIAVAIYDEKDMLLFEMGIGFKWKDSVEAEATAMYLLMKRAMKMTPYFYAVTDCDKVENVLRAGYLRTAADRKTIFPLLCCMRRHFKRFTSRRMPRDGIGLVDAVMKIKRRYQAKVLLNEWQENLDGKPLFSIEGEAQGVNNQQDALEIYEDVCYIVAHGEEKLHIAKHIVESFRAEDVRVMAKNIESVTNSFTEMFEPQGCKISRSGSFSTDLDFGHDDPPRKLCLVFDVELQKVPCTPVEGYTMTVLMIHPDEITSPNLHNVPELSARSKACFKYAKPPAMRPMEIEDVAGHDMLIKGKKVIKKGRFEFTPRTGHRVKVHYSVLYDGEKVEPSHQSSTPFQFVLGQGPFKGLDLAVKTMKIREHSLFTIPTDLVYGEFGLPPNIPVNAALQLDVQLVSWRADHEIHDICGDGCLMKNVLKDGIGKQWEKPKDFDQVTVKYEAKLSDGTVVSKSDSVEFTVKEGFLCPAVAKAVEHMRKGELARLTVRPKYGFGEYGRPACGEEGAIPPSADMEIDLEVISWKRVTEIGDPGSKILKRIYKHGEGNECPSEASAIKVRVTGRLQDGTIFMRKGYDDSEPFLLNIDSGELFYGLRHAILKMKKGEVAFVTLPPEYAYGSIRSRQDFADIPPDSTLVYEVELVSFKRVRS